MARDRERKQVVMFDGFSTWAYVDRAWTRLDIAVPPLRTSARMVFSTARRRVAMVGGIALSEYLEDMWELDEAGWQEVIAVGERPAPRAPLPLAAHASSLLLFGGPSPFEVLGDTWLFQYRSSTPDEICADGVDNDDDRRVDAADPGCT